MTQKRYQEFGDDTDFMPAVLAAEHLKEGHSGSIFLISISLTCLVLGIWAYFAEVDEITRGEGKVIPSSKIQVIEHLEGGIIKELPVHEGDIVERDQLLIRVDNTIARARYEEGKTLFYRSLAAVARLRAQIADKELEVPEEVQKHAPAEAEDSKRLYKSRIEDLNNAVGIARREVTQKQQELNELTSRSEELGTQLGLIKQKLEQIRPLVAQKLEPSTTLTDLKIRESEIRSEYSVIQSSIAKAQSAVSQAGDKLRQVPIKFKAEEWNELKEASNKLAEARGNFTSDVDRFTRTDVRSPVKGIIKQLLVTTVGGVIKPGEPLLEIVPLEDTLLIEARVQPRDVAFLHPGLQASVKITAYDYSIYGDLKAELLRVSADSITDDKGNTFYKAYLRTKGTILSKAKKPLPIIPGMVATVDILTGKKTIWDYLMKPILKARETALTER
jgi:adhesin transport system membrane fusion protein